MFVTRYMTPAPRTVTADTTIAEAWALLKEHHFRHLPIVDTEGRLEGMVTDRDIRSATPSPLLTDEEQDAGLIKLSSTPVRAIMTWPKGVLTRDATLDDALLLLDRELVGALPVVDDNGKIIGILSIRDLMRAYRTLFGLGEKGSLLIEIKPDGQPHPLSRLIGVLEEASIPFSRIIPVNLPSESTLTEGASIFVRIHTFNRSQVFNKLEGAGFRVGRKSPA